MIEKVFNLGRQATRLPNKDDELQILNLNPCRLTVTPLKAAFEWYTIAGNSTQLQSRKSHWYFAKLLFCLIHLFFKMILSYLKWRTFCHCEWTGPLINSFLFVCQPDPVWIRSEFTSLASRLFRSINAFAILQPLPLSKCKEHISVIYPNSQHTRSNAKRFFSIFNA